MSTPTLSRNHYVSLLEEYIHYVKHYVNIPPPLPWQDYPFRGMEKLFQSLKQCCQRSILSDPEKEHNFNLIIYGEVDAERLRDDEHHYDFTPLPLNSKIPEIKPDGLVYYAHVLSEDSINDCRRIRDQFVTCQPLTTFLVYDSAAHLTSRLRYLACRKAMILLDACSINLPATIFMYLYLHRAQISRMLDHLFDSLPAPLDPFLTKLDAAIERMLPDEDFNISALCRAMYYSRSQLTRKVRRASGLSISNYVNHYKLEKSRSLLSLTDWSIGRIATELGYSSQQYYCGLFKKKYGCSPRIFREQKTGRRKMSQ